MQEERGRSMSDPFSVHGTNETEIIDMAGGVWKQFADPPARLAVPCKFPRRFHDTLVGPFVAAVRNRPGVVEGGLPAVVPFQAWFIVERVHLARSTLHEQKNDTPGAWAEMRGFKSQGVIDGPGESGESEIAKAAREFLQRLAPSKRYTEIAAGRHGII